MLMICILDAAKSLTCVLIDLDDLCYVICSIVQFGHIFECTALYVNVCLTHSAAATDIAAGYHFE